MYRNLVYLLIALCLVSVLPILASEAIMTAPLPEDPALTTGTLENGLRYIIRPNAQPVDRAELRLIVDAGTIDEDDDQLGLAHFTEHMVFKGTKSFSKQQMISYLNSIGMGFGGGLNAFTSTEVTCYSLSSPTKKTDQLEKAVQILSEMAFQARFDHAELEEERGVIIEEWRMYQGASQRIMDQEQSVLLQGSRYAQRSAVVGTYEVLSTFPRDAIVRFYQDWYRPDLMTLLIIGDVDPTQVKSFINTHFGAQKMPDNPRPKMRYSVPDHEEPLFVTALDDEMPYVALSLNWKKEILPQNTFEDYLRSLTINLGTQMLSTRLEETAMVASPPWSEAFVGFRSLTKTKANLSFDAYIQEDKILPATLALLVEAERVRQHGFTQGEFQRALSSLQTNLERRVLEKDKEGSNRLTWSYLGKVLFDQPLIGEEQQLMLFNLAKELIKVEDVDRAFSALITDENFVFTLRGPNKPEIHYPAEEEVFALRKGIQSQVINPYVDETLEQPLLTGIPNPRKIRKTQVLKKSGITKWVLANGATVYALKTTNKNDEILFSAYSPGGLSLYPPEDVVTARHATGIVFESGFGDFNRINLNKALAGKTLYLNADIGVFEENLRGSFAPRDAESFFQYLFQILTNPRNCSDSFASYLQKQITFEENSQLDPETVFWETVEVITNGNNPYLRPETATEIKQIDHKRALEIYMDRFGDFSDFTFFFVGNFEEQTLKRFSEVYLANLPSLKRKEKPGNIRLQYPQGQLTRTINLGKDEKSMVLGINIHKSKFKLQDQIAMGALEQLMSEKLRINIREARSGAYAVQFQADLKKVPDSKSLFYTMLYCAPDRHEELFSAIYATLDSVKAGNITSSELASVKTTLQKNLESQMISNRFFLEQMRSNFADGFPVDSYLKIKQQYEKLDRKRLIKLLKKYMTHEEDLIRIIRLPRTDA